MPGTAPLELHKALADDTRYRLYRYIGLASRPVSVREMSQRLSLHPNTLRPHLRRLEEAGLVSPEVRKTATVGRPQTLYSIREPEGESPGEYRLLAEMLLGLVRGKRAAEQAHALAHEWGAYLMGRGLPRPGSRRPTGPNLALLQEAMAEAGFDPRFRRVGEKVEVTLRSCPFRDLADDHRELVCTMHRGLIEGMLSGLTPPMRLTTFQPLVERGICRLTAG